MTIPTPPSPPGPETQVKLKMSKDEVVGFISKMIDILTWKRVGLMTLFASCSLLMYIGFENRTTIVNKVFHNTPLDSITAPWELTDASKGELTKLTNSQQLLGGVLVMEVNLKKNRRTVKFWQVKDASLRAEATKVAATILPQSFFNEDRKNNEQMLAILNNRFMCVPTTDTVYPKFFPDVHKTIPFVCRLAVPPFAGQFAGFVTLFLTRAPSPVEIDALKIELARISIEMYLRDIERQPKGQR